MDGFDFRAARVLAAYLNANPVDLINLSTVCRTFKYFLHDSVWQHYNAFGIEEGIAQDFMERASAGDTKELYYAWTNPYGYGKAGKKITFGRYCGYYGTELVLPSRNQIKQAEPLVLFAYLCRCHDHSEGKISFEASRQLVSCAVVHNPNVLSYLPQYRKDFDIVQKALLHQSNVSVDYVDKSFYSNPRVIRSLAVNDQNLKKLCENLDTKLQAQVVAANGKAYEYASWQVRQNPVVVLDALKQYPHLADELEFALEDDYDFVLKLLEEVPSVSFRWWHWLDDRGLLKAAIKSKGVGPFTGQGEHYLQDEEMAKLALQHKPWAIPRFLSPWVPNYRYYMEEAVKKWPYCLGEIPEELITKKLVLETCRVLRPHDYVRFRIGKLRNKTDYAKDKVFLKELLKYNASNIKDVHPSLKDDKELWLSVLGRSPFSYEDRPKSLTNDIDLAFLLITTHGPKYLDLIPAALKTPEFYERVREAKPRMAIYLNSDGPTGEQLLHEMATVADPYYQPGFVYQAPKHLTDDREFALAACKMNGKCFGGLSKRLQADRELVKLALCTYDLPSEFDDRMPPELKRDKELAIEVAGHECSGLMFFDEKLQHDYDVLRACVEEPQFSERSFSFY